MIRKIYLVRHGQTELNAAHLIQGQGINAGLNEIGISQARAFWEQYKSVDFSLIVYSNLLRSKQSVRNFLIEGRRALEAIDLREISWGNIEGKPDKGEVHHTYTAVVKAWENGLYESRVMGGESIKEINDRCQHFLDWFLPLDMETVLICSHGRTIRVLGCLLMNLPLTAMKDFPHSNTGVYIFERVAERWVVTLNNDTKHLNGIA